MYIQSSSPLRGGHGQRAGVRVHTMGGEAYGGYL